MVVPAKSQFRYKEDSRELFKGAVPLWKNGLPDISKAFPQIDQERAVVVEFDFTRLETFLNNGKVFDEESVVVLTSPLPTSAIKAMYLKSQLAIDDFLLRLTDDVVADRDLFGVLGAASTIAVEGVYEINDYIEPERVINFADRFGGAIKSLELLAGPFSSGIDYPAILSSTCIEHCGLGGPKNFDHKINQAIAVDDRAIIESLIDILSNIYPEQGFDQDSVLAEIEEKLSTLESEYQTGVRRWLDFCRKVVRSEKELPELDDRGDIIKRGVLLFLMRPELERLRSALHSPISPGASVFSVAVFLSGFFTGIFRLGSEYKGSFSEYSQFTEHLVEAFWCSPQTGVESIYEEHPKYGTSLALKINGVGLWSREIQKNLILARVQSLAASRRYDLQYDYEKHRLTYVLTLNEGRTQRIYIELTKPLKADFEVIRFISPCQDLSGSKRKRVLTKDKAIDLLLRNSRDDMNCSFAVSEPMAAIVVEATQVVHTMDDEELELLLTHVATVADEYERDVLGRDFY